MIQRADEGYRRTQDEERKKCLTFKGVDPLNQEIELFKDLSFDQWGAHPKIPHRGQGELTGVLPQFSNGEEHTWGTHSLHSYPIKGQLYLIEENSLKGLL